MIYPAKKHYDVLLSRYIIDKTSKMEDGCEIDIRRY